MKGPLRVASPAKLNLFLNVLGSRPDGFHDIESIAVGLDWGDDLEITDDPQSANRLQCADSRVPSDESNLIVRAAKLMAQEAAAERRWQIRLEKRIPLGGGMGGGSSNAAATLWGLNRLWEIGLDAGRLTALGALIGSDVPLFFSLPAVQMTGRGEQVTPIKLDWAGWFILIGTGIEVSTASVYRAWRREDEMGADQSRQAAVIHARSARELNAAMINGLEPAIHRVAPEMGRIRLEAERALGLPVRITGAGGVLFAAFDEAGEAAELAIHAEKLRPGMQVWTAPVLVRPVWQL